MAKKINPNKQPLFGIEVEFFIVDKKGYPVLNSNELIRNECLTIDASLSIALELSSFQIEINPGSWTFDKFGLQKSIQELKKHYQILKTVVENHNWQLCESFTPKNISQEIIDNVHFFTNKERFKASSNYFKKRNDIFLSNSTKQYKFPGEKIIGVINEIHIHVQFSNDKETLVLFNYFNQMGLKLTKPYNQEIIFGEHIFKGDDSISLFKKANGEWNNERRINRVGCIPFTINSYTDYQEVLNSFKKIPLKEKTFLDLESTVYFWTRLRGGANNLRVEFRPMEMGVDWLDRVKYLYKIIKKFEEEKVVLK